MPSAGGSSNVAPLDAPSAPPSAPIDVWDWIDQQMAQARTPEEHRELIALIELLVAQEPDEEDPRT